MSPTDKMLARHDPAIKGLSLLLDEAAMQDIIRQSFPHAGIAGLQKKYIRYKPGTNCLVKYQLVHAGGQSDIYAKAYGGQANDKLAKVRQHPLVSDSLGLGRMTIPGQGIVICSFPNDDKLKSLHRLFESDSRNHLIDRAMFNPKHFRDSQLDQLQYKPERRFVGKLQSPSGEQAVIKLYTQARFDMASLTARKPLPGDFMPTLIGCSKKHRILVLNWIEGKRLSDEYAASGLRLSSLQNTGEQLALFHQMAVPELVHQRSSNQFIASLHELASGISHLVPALGDLAQSLAQGLAQGISSLTTARTLIHGDFYAKQVILTDDGVRFIDLDDVCHWYSACDLGLFIAHLEWDVLREILTENRAKSMEQALLEGYSSRAHCDPAEVHLFAAVGLMQLAHHPFRNCEHNWPARIKSLLTRCETRLNQFTSITTDGRGNSLNQAGDDQSEVTLRDPKMPFLPRITDASRIEHSLRQVLQNYFGNIDSSVLQKPLLRRHKPGKRVLVEYTFDCVMTNKSKSTFSVLGKARAKGLDKHAWKINKQLYARGFDAASKDGIQVPEPLGVIEQHHMWLQRTIKGQNPFPMITGSDGKAVAARVAQAIHKLHSSGISSERIHTLADEMEILESSIIRVMRARPEWQERLQELFARCKQLAGSIPDTQITGIHRDFYHDQLLINKDRVYLLDLDLYSMGDPAIDVGNFAAHIQEQCLREFGNPYHASDNIESFIEAYCQLSGTDIRSTVEIYALLTMVRHIFISQRITSRRAHTESIMKHCEQYLV